MKQVLFRADDSRETPVIEIMRRRRVRNGDNGEDKQEFQAQRCQAQLKAETFRTVATWAGGSLVAVVSAVMVANYVVVKDSENDIRRDLSAAIDSHRHDDFVRVRELEVLRDSLASTMQGISDQIAGISQDIHEHSVIAKHAGAMPLPDGNP